MPAEGKESCPKERSVSEKLGDLLHCLEEVSDGRNDEIFSSESESESSSSDSTTPSTFEVTVVLRDIVEAVVERQERMMSMSKLMKPHLELNKQMKVRESTLGSLEESLEEAEGVAQALEDRGAVSEDLEVVSEDREVVYKALEVLQRIAALNDVRVTKDLLEKYGCVTSEEVEQARVLYRGEVLIKGSEEDSLEFITSFSEDKSRESSEDYDEDYKKYPLIISPYWPSFELKVTEEENNIITENEKIKEEIMKNQQEIIKKTENEKITTDVQKIIIMKEKEQSQKDVREIFIMTENEKIRKNVIKEIKKNQQEIIKIIENEKIKKDEQEIIIMKEKEKSQKDVREIFIMTENKKIRNDVIKEVMKNEQESIKITENEKIKNELQKAKKMYYEKVVNKNAINKKDYLEIKTSDEVTIIEEQCEDLNNFYNFCLNNLILKLLPEFLNLKTVPFSLIYKCRNKHIRKRTVQNNFNIVLLYENDNKSIQSIERRSHFKMGFMNNLSKNKIQSMH